MNSLSRRTFLTTTAAGLGLPFLPKHAFAAGLPVLRAAPATAQIAPQGYGMTQVWAYGDGDAPGRVPGPEIRVKAGDRVQRTLVNGLDQPTAVHWHGIRIDNAMDGAPGLTQDAVEPGNSFDYDFVAPDAGTYWYHSHNRSWEQVARGLAGPLIVEDAEPWEGLEGAATREMVLVLDDWRLTRDGTLDEEGFGDLHDWAHGGRLGNTVTINGLGDAEIAVRAGERLRLRLINAATARIMPLRIADHAATLIALDGRPVAPRAEETVLLAPAQRADIVIDASGAPGDRAAVLLDAGRGDWVQVATLVYGDEPALPAQAGPVRPLPDVPFEAPALDTALKVDLLMEGGAMGGLSGAILDGVERDFRELAAQKRVWAFNGIAGDMDSPMFEADRGRTVHMTMRNDTAFPHAIHLHGHHFEVLTRDGTPAPHRDRRDTVLLDPREVVEIAFVADNPGKWMLHCHMLGHQAAGMMSWFRVG